MPAHLLDERAHGVFLISATPFQDDGSLDIQSLERLIGFYIDCGVHGITILGMMGEAQKLTFDESRLVIARVLQQVAGEVPVVVGVSAPGLATVAALTSDAMSNGAAGVMVAPPSGLAGDERVLAYMTDLRSAIGPDVPLVFQDYPQATGVPVPVPLFEQMVHAFPQIVVLKHEDCPGLGKISRIRALSHQAGLRRVSILVGNGALYYPLELMRGADGAMSGFAFPEVLVRVYDLFQAGSHQAAFDLFDAYLPLIRYEQQPGMGLAIRKEILKRRGVIASAALRAPGMRLGPADQDELTFLLRRLEHTLARFD